MHGNPAVSNGVANPGAAHSREKAASNATAQALLADIAGFYAVWHGPRGLSAIARRIHGFAKLLSASCAKAGVAQRNDAFFDTLRLEPPAGATERIKQAALAAQLNFRYREDGAIDVALDETTTLADIEGIVKAFAAGTGAVSGFDASPENLVLDFPARWRAPRRS